VPVPKHRDEFLVLFFQAKSTRKLKFKCEFSQFKSPCFPLQHLLYVPRQTNQSRSILNISFHWLSC